MPGTAPAKELFGPDQGVVPFGMGRAYSACADDNLSLYYNPAGLAMVSKVDLQLFDLRVGASNDVIKSYGLVGDLGKSGSMASTLSSLAGKNILAVAGNNTQVTVPHVSLAVNYDTVTVFDMQNLSYPSTYMRHTKDLSILLGGAVNSADKAKTFRLGAALKWVSRTGGEKNISVAQIMGSKAALKDLFSQSGSGIGGDVGMQFRLPFGGRQEYTTSFVWHDVGKTSFGGSTAVNPPSRINDNMVAGFAARFPIGGTKNRRLERRYGPSRSGSAFTLAYDFSHINYPVGREPWMKHSHLGANLDLPILSLQVGLNQTSLTFGFAFDISIVRVAFATYAEEIGYYAGQRPDRRYLLSIGSALGFGGF